MAQRYYAAQTDAIGAQDAIDVRVLDRPKGKGVFALRAFLPGQTVFAEQPLVSTRFVAAQRRVCCSHCLRTMLRPDDLGAYRAAYDLLVSRFPQTANVPCAQGCSTAIYCSTSCRDRAWDVHHRALCPGHADDHPVIALEALCRDVDRTNPWMVARCFAMVQQQLDRDGITVDEAMWPFLQFEGHQADGTKDAEIFALIETIFAADPRMKPALTMANYRHLNGAMLQNAQQLHPVSDLHKFLELKDAHALAQMLSLFQLKIPQLHAFRTGQFMSSLTVAGTGMFPIANCTNHSCAPNVVSMSRSTDHTLDVVAIRPIAAGDELHISYIDETLPRAQRQQQLLQYYKFACDCEKCTTDT